MLPIKRILCPIDFSDFSLEALSNARELAAHFSSELCLVHVIQTDLTPYYLAPYSGEMFWDQAGYENSARASAQHQMDKIAISSGLQEIEFHSVIRLGNPTDEILGAAKDERADLIVIATHGWSGWRHLAFGSVAEKVVRLSTCPILVLHMHQPGGKAPC